MSVDSLCVLAEIIIEQFSLLHLINLVVTNAEDIAVAIKLSNK